MRDEYRPGMTLREYANAWVDMAPHLDQLTALALWAKVVVEWGLRGGVSTWALLDGLPPDGKLVGVDIVPDSYLPLPPRVKEDPRFTLICGDDLLVELPHSIDLLMIDSSHEYFHTVAELDRVVALGPKVVALHDYLYSDTPGVKRAVDEFVKWSPYRLDVVHPSRWGLAVLLRK
jgi:hypothetical protein